MAVDKRAYRILFLAFLGWFINFADRQLIGPLLPLIQQDFSLSNTQVGLLASAFFIGYSISPIPGGMLSDRYGHVKILGFSVLGFGISTFFTGLASGVIFLVAVRAVTGIFEGSYYSSAVGYVTSVFPKEKRGFASSLYSTGWTLGSFAGMIFATASLLNWDVMTAVNSVISGTPIEPLHRDWRLPWKWMLVPTLITGLLILLKMPFIPLEERAAYKEQKEKTSHSLKDVLKIRNAWLIFALQFIANFGTWSIATFTPKYLNEVKGFSLVLAGGITALMFIPGTIGSLFSGTIADKIGRKLTVSVFYIASGLLWYLVMGAHGPQDALMKISIAGFFITGLYPVILAWMTDSVPSEVVSSATGFGIMGAELGAFTTPIISGYLADTFSLQFAMNIFIWTYVFGGLIVWFGRETNGKAI